MAEYPKREPFFANRAVRLLFKSCAIMDIGDLAALIVIMVAHQEDAARYRGPVRFWNREFRDTLGASENRVNRARKRAIDAGWLHYEPRDISSGNNRSVGLYWVTIPEGLDSLNDSPVGDVITHSSEGNSGGNYADNTHASEGKTGGIVKVLPGESCGDSRGNGVDTSNLTLSPTPAPVPAVATQQELLSTNGSSFSKEILSVIEHYKTFHPKARPGDKEKTKIRARLKDGYSAEDLQTAIDGCHRSPFHCGENDSGKKYQSLELIMRDASKTQMFIEVPQVGEEPVLSQQTRRNMRAGESFLRRHGALPDDRE